LPNISTLLATPVGHRYGIDLGMTKEFLAGVAIVLTFAMYVPYIRSIRRGQTKPHVISWVIWTLCTTVVFLALLAGGGGSGAWPIGVTASITAYVAFLAHRQRADASITNADRVFLGIAVAALPCWLLTNNPLLAVVLLTGIELAGFGPTLRNAIDRPYDEHIGFYLLGVARNTLVVAALEHYAFTTVLYPAAKGLAGGILVAILAYRRAQLRQLGEAGSRFK
jgi:hypothetical protein